MGFLGMGMSFLYTGITKTKVLVPVASILMGNNMIFNYGLIFGKLGLPELGIGGAAIASNISEFAGLLAFVIHTLVKDDFKKYDIPSRVVANFRIAKDILKISMQLLIQASAGVASWFVLFSLVENMGERELARSEERRILYLIFSIPLWG